MTKKDETSAAPASEWVDRAVITGDEPEQEGEWNAPTEGMVLQGVLEKAFVLPDDNNPGSFRACYGIRDSHGVLMLTGERSFFQDAIRAERLGTPVKLTFTHKAKMPGGKSPWRGSFASQPGAGVGGAVVKAALKASYEAIKARNDLPF